MTSAIVHGKSNAYSTLLHAEYHGQIHAGREGTDIQLYSAHRGAFSI